MELLGMSRFWDMFAECAVVKRGEFGVIGGGKQPRTETRLRLRAGIQPVIEFIDATDNTDRWVQTSESSCSSNLWNASNASQRFDRGRDSEPGCDCCKLTLLL
jgi:hypothetical protein